jgi:hypothetical protein
VVSRSKGTPSRRRIRIKRKEGNESDEQPHEQTEKAPCPAFTQARKHRAVPFALCDVALLDAVLCG